MDRSAARRLAACLAGVLLAAAALGGCSSTTVIRAAQQAEMPAWADAMTEVPVPPPGTMRLYVYRPQALLGMWGSAIVIIDDHWLGDRNASITDNLLLPGAVFVVDVPAAPTRAWAYQSGRGEDRGLAVELAPTRPAWYLRWVLKPTYGHLELVDDSAARAEIQSLRYSGYRRIAGR